VVGNIGGPGRVNYTVVGDSVNVAQRLEDMGHQLLPDRPEVGILVSGATLVRLPRETVALDTGHFTLRGRAEMTAVYRLAPPATHAAVA
jgi:adenylate cyclase